MECTYDGGDCCGPNVNTQYCSDCSCLDPNGGNGGNTTTTTASTTGNQIYFTKKSNVAKWFFDICKCEIAQWCQKS